MKLPRIILVTTHYPPLVGGAATYFDYLGAGLVGRGHLVTVLTTRVTGAPLVGWRDGVRVWRLIPGMHSAPPAVRKVVQTVATVFWVCVLRLRQPIRTLHAHASKSVTVGAAIASLLLRIPVVYDVQDFLSRPNVIRRGWRRRYVATGNPLRDHLQRLAIPEEAVTTISSVPPDDSRMADVVKREHTYTQFLFVGELSHEIKGTDVLIEAMAIAYHQASDIRLRLIGDGPDGDHDRARVRTLGLDEVVTFSGVQKPAAVRAAMDQADCLVVSSRTEGMPRVILEAFARGLPVVATRVGGIPEVVHDDQNGLLVPMADVGALAAAMVRMATDRTLRVRLGLAGHAWVATLPTWAEVVAQIDEHYAR